MTRSPVVLSIGLAISLAGPMAFRPALAQSSKTARLKARPTKVLEPATPGLDTLDVSPTRDAYIYVPRGYDPNHRAPLLVLLHGATQSADLWTRSSELFTLADSLGMVLLIPNSQDRTWDLMIGGFGPDVRVLDSALTLVFHRLQRRPEACRAGRLLGWGQLCALPGSEQRRPVQVPDCVFSGILRAWQGR